MTNQNILTSLFTFKTFILMILGVVLATVALKGFMIPNGFLDGGVTGVSLLIHEVYHIPFSLLLVSLNLFFLIPAYKLLGKAFAIRSFIAVVLLAIGVHFVSFPVITTDKLLIAIFGGSFIGLGMGLVIRSGAAIDGFEVLALFTTEKSGFSMGEVILFFNCIIFLIAATKFGIESAMYSIITYFTALKMADYVVDGIEEYISLNIISKEHDQIKSLLSNYFGKGITILKGERGYLPGSFEERQDCDIIFAIVTRLELVYIRQELKNRPYGIFIHLQNQRRRKRGISKEKG